MPKRIAVNTVTVVRRKGEKKERVDVRPGTLFDFTADEIKDLEERAPESIRKPTNEDPTKEAVELPESDEQQRTDGGAAVATTNVGAAKPTPSPSGGRTPALAPAAARASGKAKPDDDGEL